MSITPVSIAWSFLQITLLCSCSLFVAWLLRGRRPQLVAAMLAGACVATLALAVVSIVPACQWSAAIPQVPKPEPFAALHEEATGRQDSLTSSTEESDAPPKRVEESRGYHTVFASSETSGFDRLHQLVSHYLQRVDREVRDAEVWQRPIANARNVSLLLFIAIGLIAMSALWCCSWLDMRRILLCSKPVSDRELLEAVAGLSVSFGLKQSWTVRESSLIPIGATVGWRHVTVLLHSDWRCWSPEERTAVIAHELAHAIRHDFVWVVISSWTRNLLFFHPMVHALIHRLRLEQELAADQLAAGKVGNAKAYGRALASLALRSQRSHVASSARFGSMLSAGQICVTRRIIMLKQGSLKPIQTRSRWSIWAVVAIACTAIPLAGLRGTTQEPVVDRPANESPKEENAAGTSTPKQLSREFLEAYPPLEFKGSTVYRPGRFRSGEFGPEVAWINDWISISMLGQPFPDQAVVYGEGHNAIKWTDEERQHGFSSLGFSFHEAEATNPGQLTRCFHLPFEFANRQFRVVSTETFDGRKITGVTNSKTEEVPEKWLIDDEFGYFLGTLDEAKQYVRGQRFAVESIPENFREDFQNAAFGIVFSDCETWPSKIESFFNGAPQKEKFQVFGLQPSVAMIKDITQIGFFVDGCKSPACSIRAITKDAPAAKRLANQIRTFVELSKLALASVSTEAHGMELQAAQSILDTLEISESGTELRVQFDIFVSSVSHEMKALSTMLGWININSYPTNESNGTVASQVSDMVISFPSLVGQTLDAVAYRGKTVEFELDIQCSDDDENRAGAFVWASKKETTAKATLVGRTPRQQGSPFTGHRVLAAKTLAANGTSTFSESIEIARNDRKVFLLHDAPYRKLKVQLSVPTDAEQVSFGFYSKNSQVRVKNVKFIATELSNPTSDQFGINATADVPYNILLLPGYKIGSEPTNLNFESSASETVRQAAGRDASEASTVK